MCYIINDLLNKELIRRNFQFAVPKITKEDNPLEKTEEFAEEPLDDDVLSPKQLVKFQQYITEDNAPIVPVINPEDWMSEVRSITPLLKEPNELLFGDKASGNSLDGYAYIQHNERYKATINLVKYYHNEFIKLSAPIEAYSKVLGCKLEAQLENIRIKERSMNSHITPSLVA